MLTKAELAQALLEEHGEEIVKALRRDERHWLEPADGGRPLTECAAWPAEAAKAIEEWLEY